MKLLRSRIRIISLFLTCAFLAVILWGTHAILFSETSREMPAPTVAMEVSVESPSPSVLITVPPETPSPTSGELFDTFGL